MVADRSSMLLTKRLLSDSYPVLLEGIQCTSCLNSLNKKKKVVVRLHNIESEYYHVLYQGEKNPIKKIYFLLESILLKKYEQEIFTQQTCLTVSDKDAEWIQNRFPASKVKHLPVFISDNELTTPLDLGSFCLYHANLSVNENEAAAIWLLKEVFHHTSIPLVIAGKNPSNKLIKLAHEKTNTCIVANPDKHEMEDLIRKAQINILPSLNQTGVKIKIIESLQIGRHCITNGNGSGDRKLDEMLIVTTSSNEMLEKIESLYNTPFRKEDKTFRDEKMRRIFDSERQTKELISLLY